MDAECEAQDQSGDRCDTEDLSGAAREGADTTVCEEEAELLQREPDEREVQESDQLDPGPDARSIHGGAGGDEQADREPGRALVGGDQGGQQHLAEQEDPEEPQRLPEPVARHGHQLLGDPVQQQRGQTRADDGDRDDGRQDQAVDAGGDETCGRPPAPPRPDERGVPGEAADHEEQRHDLHHPTERSDPRRSLAGVGEEGTGVGDRDPDHHRVQHDDAEYAQRAHQIDPGVAPRA